MPWNWMILIGAFILGMNLGVVWIHPRQTNPVALG